MSIERLGADEAHNLQLRELTHIMQQGFHSFFSHRKVLLCQLLS